MVPALLPGDHVLVDRQAYVAVGRFSAPLPPRSPRRGDVVVFRRPGDVLLVKRVVALPGEIVEIEDGQLWINGERRSEPWARALQGRIHPLRLRSREIYVIGDQHSRSRDSRHWGPARIEWLRGRAELIYWSSARLDSSGGWGKIQASAWERISSTRWRRWLQPVR